MKLLSFDESVCWIPPSIRIKETLLPGGSGRYRHPTGKSVIVKLEKLRGNRPRDSFRTEIFADAQGAPGRHARAREVLVTAQGAPGRIRFFSAAVIDYEVHLHRGPQDGPIRGHILHP